MPRVFLAFLAKGVRAQLGYPLNFGLSLATAAVSLGMDLFLLSVVMAKFGSLGGWSYWEIAFMVGMLRLGTAVGRVVLASTTVEWDLREGTFDAMLLTPVHPILQMSFRTFAWFNLGDVFSGAALLWLAGARLALAWTPALAGQLAIAVVSCAVLDRALRLCFSSLAFWVNGGEAVASMSDYFRQFLSYPLPIFGRTIEWLLTFVLPYGFLAYYPARHLLGRGAEGSLPATLGLLSPAVALAAAAAALALWTAGTRKYAGAGS